MFEFWRRYAFEGPPFVHPLDGPCLGGALDQPLFGSFRQFALSASFCPPTEALHLSLYPQPYVGDVERAEVVILMSGPGVEYADYAELDSPTFRSALRRNIEQNFTETAFPFLFLDPEFAWHPGFRWWERKFRNLALYISSAAAISYPAALRLLARKVAVIEALPYHAGAIQWTAALRRLPSTGAALRYVTGLRSSRPDTAVIAVRQARLWNAPVSFDASLARSAPLGPESAVGKAVLARCGFVQRPSKDVVTRLGQAVERLVGALRPKAIYLFGSQARGEAGPDSDFDLMIVVPGNDRTRTDPGRPYEILRGTGLAIDALLLSEERFEHRLHVRASLPATVADEGRVLYAARP